MTDPTETPVTPWPSWLENLTPADRVKAILRSVGSWHSIPGKDRETAEGLLLRVLDEVRPDQFHSETPAAPWPGWLEGLTDKQRVSEIICAVAACYEDHGCRQEADHEAGGERHCTAIPAERFLLRLLAEARAEPAAVPSARGDEGLTGDDAPEIPWPARTPEQKIQGIVRALNDEGADECSPAEAEAFMRVTAERLAELENAVNWHTTCTSCARVLDSSIRETGRRERAEELLESALRLIDAAYPGHGRGNFTPGGGPWQTAAATWITSYRDLVAEYAAGKAEPAAEPEPAPLPPGQFARVELMGHNPHTGWVTDGTRAGVPVMVISDWDGRVIAEAPGASLYRYVPLPTPQKRPEQSSRAQITAGTWHRDDPDDDPGDYEAAHAPGCHRDFCDGECTEGAYS